MVVISIDDDEHTLVSIGEIKYIALGIIVCESINVVRIHGATREDIIEHMLGKSKGGRQRVVRSKPEYIGDDMVHGRLSFSPCEYDLVHDLSGLLAWILSCGVLGCHLLGCRLAHSHGPRYW